jgi:opacity protein-like surface antigen
MKTSLMAAAMVAAVLSAAAAIAGDDNSPSQYGTKSIAVIKAPRTASSTEHWGQATPVVLKTTPISIESGVRRRAALATLLLVGAAAPCLRAEGKVLIPGGGC